MANILLVDPAELSRRAMKGILARGHHRLVAVNTPLEAWDFVSQHVKVDLAFVELKLEGENGLTFVERLRSDAFFKLLPVVIYTSGGDRDAVRRALALKVQNFMVKPYQEEHIFAEIAKAQANPWRERHFEEEKSFCKMMGFTPAELHAMLEELNGALKAAEPVLLACVQSTDTSGAVEKLAALAEKAEAAGAWGVVELTNDLKEKAQANAWPAFQQSVEGFGVADRMIVSQLSPGALPVEFLTEDERNAEEEARARAVWTHALAQSDGAMTSWPELQRKLDALTDCPVIDSVAASFQMSATGHPSSIAPLMELAARDPGLAASLLAAANKMRNVERDPEPLGDPRMAVALLGELKLTSLARGMVMTEERLMRAGLCTWASFRMFQLGVAHMARYTCAYLEMPSLEEKAYAAGLLHDLGKLLLLHLYPHGFHVMLEHARDQRVGLGTIERRLLGATSWEIGSYFATQRGLPPSYASVMRWVDDDPGRAGEDAELTALVGLARRLCRQNHVGWFGDTHRLEVASLDQTPEWEVLRPRVFPSFSLKKFEEQAHAACKELKMELYGKLAAVAE